MPPRRSERGMTLIELLLSVMLSGTIAASLMNVYIAGQSSALMSEASLVSHQTARNALEVIQQDLSGARIVSYYDGPTAGVGNGKVYVKFQRIKDKNIVDVNGRPVWAGTFYMYIWCPDGSNTPPGPNDINACQFMPADRRGQLLLVRKGTVLNEETWQLERVLIAGSDSGDSSSQGFVTQFRVQASTATGLPVRMANQIASGGCAGSAEGECISPFTGPPAQVRIQLTSQASSAVVGGRRLVNAPVAGNVTLRNPQN